MTSVSLFSSLFRGKSALNRSSSLISKALVSGENKRHIRSQSICIDTNKNLKEQYNYRPLLRLAHIFAIKAKKHNYFLFCRLEANLKSFRDTQIGQIGKQGQLKDQGKYLDQAPNDSSRVSFQTLKLHSEIKESQVSTFLFAKVVQEESEIKSFKQKKFQSDIFDSESDERERIKQKQFKKNTILIKKKTKIRVPNKKINFPKASLAFNNEFRNEKDKIQLSSTSYRRDEMTKHNHLYHQILSEEIPDLHDNLAVFSLETLPSQIDAKIDIESINTFRTMQQDKESEKLGGGPIHRRQVTFIDGQQNNQFDKSQTNSTEIQLKKQKSISYLNEKKNFIFSQFGKVDEIVVNAERFRSNEKKNQVLHYKKCQFSIILPNKTGELSINNSASKGSSKKGFNYRSAKKEKYSQCKKQYFKTKQFDQQKQNIRARPQTFEKNVYISEKMQQRKENKILDKATETKARKMKKEIENIMKRRKSRTSFGCLKIIRDKN